MLELAIKHKSALEQKYADIAMDTDYMFGFFCSWRGELKIAPDNWHKQQFVSVNEQGEVVGYLKYNVDRDTRNVNGIHILNFKKDTLCTTFSRDFRQMIDDIFSKYQYNKIIFSVAIGNPAEKMYDKYIEKIGGRIVGIYKEELRMMDGNMYDEKMYEVLSRDYLKAKWERMT